MVAVAFDHLLQLLIRFLHQRLNATNSQKQYLGPFPNGKPWPEKLLQHDLFDYLSALGYAGIEVITAGGRADLYIPGEGFRFVIEVKRSTGEWHGANIKALSQTAAYQQTSVRLGVLSVLDLSARAAGTPHFDRCFSVAEIKHDDDARTVVVMRVPGNRNPPSAS